MLDYFGNGRILMCSGVSVYIMYSLISQAVRVIGALLLLTLCQVLAAQGQKGVTTKQKDHKPSPAIGLI